MKTVSIIIINFNTSDVTLKCIETLIRYFPHRDLNPEVILVDNNSVYEDYENLRKGLAEKYNTVKLIRRKVNAGFAGGNMTGFEYANGDYIILVNNDVFFTHDIFTPSVAYLDRHSDVGVCGGLPILENGNRIPPFGHNETFLYKLLGNWLYEKLVPGVAKKEKEYTEPTEVDYVPGCFMAFRIDVFRNIGGLDGNIFLYYEEMDISERLRKIGLKTMYVPGMEYIHATGSSTSRNLSRKKELIISNLYVVRKNHGYLQYLLLKVFFMIVYFLKALVKWRYFKLWWVIMTMGSPLAHSMRHEQKISDR